MKTDIVLQPSDISKSITQKTALTGKNTYSGRDQCVIEDEPFGKLVSNGEAWITFSVPEKHSERKLLFCMKRQRLE
jgi:hypothetical protein